MGSCGLFSNEKTLIRKESKSIMVFGTIKRDPTFVGMPGRLEGADRHRPACASAMRICATQGCTCYSIP